MTSPAQRTHDALVRAGITSQMLREMAAIAKTEACERMSELGTLSCPTADAIGARHWLEAASQMLDAFEHLERNADLFDGEMALDRAKRDVANRPVAQLERAKELVEYKRAGGF